MLLSKESNILDWFMGEVYRDIKHEQSIKLSIVQRIEYKPKYCPNPIPVSFGSQHMHVHTLTHTQKYINTLF